MNLHFARLSLRCTVSHCYSGQFASRLEPLEAVPCLTGWIEAEGIFVDPTPYAWGRTKSTHWKSRI